MMSALECALEYASLGFKVAPRHLRDWERKATTNEKQIERWWSEHPHSDVRVATGGGLVVVTINAEEGGERNIEVFSSLRRSPTADSDGQGQVWRWDQTSLLHHP